MFGECLIVFSAGANADAVGGEEPAQGSIPKIRRSENTRGLGVSLIAREANCESKLLMLSVSDDNAMVREKAHLDATRPTRIWNDRGGSKHLRPLGRWQFDRCQGHLKNELFQPNRGRSFDSGSQGVTNSKSIHRWQQDEVDRRETQRRKQNNAASGHERGLAPNALQRLVGVAVDLVETLIAGFVPGKAAEENSH